MPALNDTRKTMLALVGASLALTSLLAALGKCGWWFLAFPAVAAGKFVFFSLSFLGAGIASLLLARAEWRARITLSMVAVELVLAALRHTLSWPVASGIGFGAGLTGLFWLWRAKNSGALADVLLLTLFPAYANAPLALTEKIRPLVMDGFVAHAEQGFGFDFARWIALVTEGAPALWHLLDTIYLLLLPALLTVYALRARQFPDRAHETILSFVLAGAFGFICYLLFPVVGPDISIDGYPLEAGGATLPRDWFLGGAAARNCMPSLHTTWALIIFFRTRGLRPLIRAGAALFAAGTMLATLGLAHHYLLDLVVAAPFAVTIDGWANGARPEDFARRIRLVAFGASLVAMWLVVLTWNWSLLEQHGWALWFATLTTLVLSIALRRAWLSLRSTE